MQNNGESVLLPQSLSIDKTIVNEYNLLKEENEKLLLENKSLKINLQKEKFYHQNLYNQWNELKKILLDKDHELRLLRSTQNPRLKIYRYAFFGLLILNILWLIFNFNLFTSPVNSTSALAPLSLPQKNDSVSNSVNSNTPAQGLPLNSTANIPDTKNSSEKFNQLNKDQIPVQSVITGTSQNPVKYFIRQKSYFHNKPDNNTRRKTFVLPGNDAYGILTALDDRNGFIYVVFINHAGRTSKGWILKSDLEVFK